MKLKLLVAMALAAVEPVAAANGESLEVKIAAKHKILVSDQWGGGHRIIFDFNGRKGWVVEPKEPAAGRPWVWTMQWMGAFLERTGAPSIVRAGGYHVHLAAFDTRANDEGLKALAEFQDYLTSELGLAPKARLIGMSWGGFYSVRYASAYPEKVASIYLDAPLLNAYTLPNLTVTNAVADAKVIGPWAASRPSGDAADDPRQAVNLAEKVAAARIPILLLYGGADQTVDPARNCELFIPRFKAAGGRIEVKRRAYYGHHPHGVDITDVSQIADFFGLPAKAASAASDEIVEGTHGYTPEGYVEPREPAVREALERFRDRKLGLMMHWGPYCQLGIVRAESWPLSDDDAGWARKGWTGGEDNEAFKRMYQDLPKTFAPSKFDPAAWADMARRDGFKYVIFTTKHHDGFCMFDSKYSDYRITNPAFPFAKDPRADIAKGVFDAFRAKGLSAVCYFSKPDWHHNDFWENAGLGVRTSRWPTYAVKSHPEKWENFRKYVRNQILELVDNYGPFDALWLDGGTCKPKWHLDVDIPGIVDEARRRNPGLISVDRTTGGPYENVVTPEQTIPPVPILAPWESCITLGKGWAYRPNDEYKGAREIIHLLVDVVAKGGNLALNVGPSPDGTFAPEAVDRLDRLGAWLARNGEALYATRPARPWRSGDWAFTGSKNGRTLYAIRLYPEGGRLATGEMIPVGDNLKVAKVVHLGTGREIPFAHPVGGVRLELPADFQSDTYADAFRIVCAFPSDQISTRCSR